MMEGKGKVGTRLCEITSKRGGIEGGELTKVE